MPSVKRKLQANESKASRFDFDRVAGSYDSWYAGRRGAMYDRLEKKLIANFLPAKTEGKRLLEIGCGTGHWSRFFSQCGFKVTGLDISERMINIALQKCIPNVSFHVGDGHLLPFQDSTFDLTAAITTLEFVRDAEVILREMIRCTRKPGRILLGMLNGLSTVNRQKQRRGNPESPYAAARLFSPVEMREFLEPYGRVEINVGGFVPTQSWLIPLAPLIDRIARMLGGQKGAFMAAVLKL
jgi:SAM-dependent methyltransferase